MRFTPFLTPHRVLRQQVVAFNPTNLLSQLVSVSGDSPSHPIVATYRINGELCNSSRPPFRKRSACRPVISPTSKSAHLLLPLLPKITPHLLPPPLFQHPSPIPRSRLISHAWALPQMRESTRKKHSASALQSTVDVFTDKTTAPPATVEESFSSSSTLRSTDSTARTMPSLMRCAPSGNISKRNSSAAKSNTATALKLRSSRNAATVVVRQASQQTVILLGTVNTSPYSLQDTLRAYMVQISQNAIPGLAEFFDLAHHIREPKSSGSKTL